jgi:hypothetical protein
MLDRQIRAQEAFDRLRTLTATIVIQAGGEPAEEREVIYARPDRWLIRDARGLMVLHTSEIHVERSSAGQLELRPRERRWFPEEETGFLLWGHPEFLDGAIPTAEPPSRDTVQVAGRPAYRETFELPGKICTLLTDVESQLLLSQSTRVLSQPTRGAFRATVTEIIVDGGLPDHAFAATEYANLPTAGPERETQAERLLDRAQESPTLTTSWGDWP